MSDDKVIEMAISLDKGYSKDELYDIAFDMRNINTKWIWLDTFSQAQMSEFKEEVKLAVFKRKAEYSCGRNKGYFGRYEHSFSAEQTYLE